MLDELRQFDTEAKIRRRLKWDYWLLEYTNVCPAGEFSEEEIKELTGRIDGLEQKLYDMKGHL